MMTRKHQLEIRVENADEKITVNEWLLIEEGNSRAVVDVMSRFVWWDGVQLSPEDGREKMGQMSMKEFKSTIELFRDAVLESAVPKDSAPE
jgi:pantothenate kinase type III